MESAQQRFKWVLQALAQTPEIQQGLYPGFVEVADELALEHEEALRSWIESGARDLATAGQLAAVGALDRQLEGMSDPVNAGLLWSRDALASRPEWRAVRRLAGAALESLGWPNSPPPRERGAIFVSDPSTR